MGFTRFRKTCQPILCSWYHSIPRENIRRPEVLSCFKQLQKETGGIKWIKTIFKFKKNNIAAICIFLSRQQRHQSDFFDFIQISLFLNLSRFHIQIQCFHWLIFHSQCNKWKKLNRGINLEVLNMPCFLLAWNYLSQANKLPSLLYQRRGADSKIDSKFSRSSHQRCSVKEGVLKISQISHACNFFCYQPRKTFVKINQSYCMHVEKITVQ